MTTVPMNPKEYLAARARAMTERQLLDNVLGTPRRPGLALALGWLGYHTHRSENSPAGYPDLTLVRGRRIVFAELKTERGKTTGTQDIWLDRLAAAGAEVYLWRPTDLLNGTIRRILADGDTRLPGLALSTPIR